MEHVSSRSQGEVAGKVGSGRRPGSRRYRHGLTERAVRLSLRIVGRRHECDVSRRYRNTLRGESRGEYHFGFTTSCYGNGRHRRIDGQIAAGNAVYGLGRRVLRRWIVAVACVNLEARTIHLDFDLVKTLFIRRRRPES